MFCKILVALDQAETSRIVFEQALSLAHASQGKLMLLHVLCPDDQDYPNPTIFPTPDSVYPSLHATLVQHRIEQWRQFEAQNLQRLQAWAAEAIDAGVSTEFTQTTTDPGNSICQSAQNWNADLIVMGRRGRSGLSEWILGSVSNYVMHHSPCSVLIVQGAIEPDLNEPSPHPSEFTAQKPTSPSHSVPLETEATPPARFF
ncbi:MAG TPA: universal stress protein [Allocoleopsis sp.]